MKIHSQACLWHWNYLCCCCSSSYSTSSSHISIWNKAFSVFDGQILPSVWQACWWQSAVFAGCQVSSLTVLSVWDPRCRFSKRNTRSDCRLSSTHSSSWKSNRKNNAFRLQCTTTETVWLWNACWLLCLCSTCVWSRASGISRTTYAWAQATADCDVLCRWHHCAHLYWILSIRCENACRLTSLSNVPCKNENVTKKAMIFFFFFFLTFHSNGSYLYGVRYSWLYVNRQFNVLFWIFAS